MNKVIVTKVALMTILVLLVGQTTSGWRIDWDNPFCKYPCGKDSEGDVIDPNKGDETPKCKLSNELLVNPNDCESYFQCVHQRASKMQCPEGLTFDDKKRACVPASINSRSDCKVPENNSKFKNTEQPPIKTFCSARIEAGEIKVGIHKLYPSLENPCRQYYICVSGGHHQMGSCPQKQSFNASNKEMPNHKRCSKLC